MDLILDNRSAVFEPPRRLLELLDKRTAFYVKGFFHSPAFKARHWDGKEHLVKRFKPHSPKFKGWYVAPSGLLGEILSVAAALEIEVTIRDERRRPGAERVEVRWNRDYQLRDYQARVLADTVADRGYETGKVLIEMPTRSGKTVVAAAIIQRLGLRTLFLVQSELLLRQTIEEFRRVLRVPIGRVGAGVWDPAPITVASIQTLTRRADSDECRELLRSFDCVIFDEAHHVQGDKWRDLLMEIDAFWKIGLSATIFLHEKKENPKGTIWIRAALGPVVSRVTTGELIEAGQLLAPTVYVHPIREARVFADAWSDVYHYGIEYHRERNAKIVEIALQRDAQGLQIVVVTRTHAHTEILAGMLEDSGLRVAVIIGPTPAGRRQRLIRLFQAGQLDVLVGTVLGEGVNIPEIGSVIVAEGGESEIRGLQRFRCLTPAPGKDRATLDDFADLHHRVLARHSIKRFRLYRNQGGFNLKDASREDR